MKDQCGGHIPSKVSVLVGKVRPQREKEIIPDRFVASRKHCIRAGTIAQEEFKRREINFESHSRREVQILFDSKPCSQCLPE